MIEFLDELEAAIRAELDTARTGALGGLGKWSAWPYADTATALGEICDERGRTVITSDSVHREEARHILAQRPAATIPRCEALLVIIASARNADGANALFHDTVTGARADAYRSVIAELAEAYGLTPKGDGDGASNG